MEKPLVKRKIAKKQGFYKFTYIIEYEKTIFCILGVSWEGRIGFISRVQEWWQVFARELSSLGLREVVRG